MQCKWRDIKNGKIAKRIETSFEHLENNKANIRAIEYIKKYEKECSYIYIALFFDYMSQGALPTTNTNAYINYGVDPNKVKIINMPVNWSIYANYMEMKLAKNILEICKLIFYIHHLHFYTDSFNK